MASGSFITGAQRAPAPSAQARAPRAAALAPAARAPPRRPFLSGAAPLAAPAARLAGGRAPRQAAAPARCSAAADYRQREPKDVRVLVVGATGYIGKFVVKELVARGYNVVAFAREQSGVGGKQGAADTRAALPGADVRFGDVGSAASLARVAFAAPVDVVVCCLASRTGGKKDSWAIDYQASANALAAARAGGAAHFVLLSAICVQKPLLEFQRAKLRFEAELAAAGDITYSIVRPTAFFKSLAGQVELVKDGKPFVFFGDGTLAACKPISERDLAAFMADCVAKPELANRMLPIGGPGGALTALDQANMLFRIAGVKPNTFPVPVALMDGIIRIFDFLAKFFPALEVSRSSRSSGGGGGGPARRGGRCVPRRRAGRRRHPSGWLTCVSPYCCSSQDGAEFAKIGRYYATESMLVWDPQQQRYLADATPSYGGDTLEAFFTQAVREGLKGQDLGDAAVFGVGREKE
jgi:divinyl chlorophyllide a 8-vinyl-reductase